MSPAITVHTLRKKVEIKTVAVLTILPSPLVARRSLNWQNVSGMKNIFGVDCWDGCAGKKGGEKLVSYIGIEC